MFTKCAVRHSRIYVIKLFCYILRSSILKPDFFKWSIPGLFFFIFVCSIQLTVNVQYNFLPMIGFELHTSGFRGDRSTNWAITTAQEYYLFKMIVGSFTYSPTHPNIFVGNFSKRDIFFLQTFIITWTRYLLCYFCQLKCAKTKVCSISKNRKGLCSIL